ncbi:MAG TPA: hypothetical protein VJ953_04715 [Saprospiraceae bacterium]|nr:hypothetical protein [Saprospiraceae bacterium]
MKRRDFTFISAAALPAAMLPVGNLLGNTYVRWQLANLQAPIKEDLEAFKTQLINNTAQFRSDPDIPKLAYSPKRINQIEFQDSRNYRFSFVNRSDNTVTLSRESGQKKISIVN